jgi:hypothetical protein
VFFIKGTTNLPVYENKAFFLSITSHNSNPRGLVYYKNLEIIPGPNGINRWSENVTDLDWNARDEYRIEALISTGPMVSDSQYFRVHEGDVSIAPAPSLTQPPSQVTSTIQQPLSHATTPSGQVAPSSSMISVYAIFAGLVFYNVFCGKMKK